MMREAGVDPARLPVSVLTGFLGSGKTTLLSRLLRHEAMGETAVIVNELGEVGLDHALVRAGAEDVLLLEGGCLCCALRSDLADTMRDLFLKRVKGEVAEFARLVIETTGLADPAPILQTLMRDPLVAARYRLDGVIATIDAVLGDKTLDREREAVKQAAMADRLLITKTDLVDAEKVAALKQRLGRLNPAAAIFPVVQGEIEPHLLFGIGLPEGGEEKTGDPRDWLGAVSGPDQDHGHDDHDHVHDARISSFCLTYERPLDWDRLARALDLLAGQRGEDLLRVKGIVQLDGCDRPVVLHGVQHLFHPPAMLAAWPDADRRSRLVFITRDLSREQVAGTLDLLLKEEELE